MPKPEGFVPLSHKDVGQIWEAPPRAGSQTFIRHVSSESDIKDCAGISTGHAHAGGKKMPKNMVFIKKMSIFREVWFSSDEKERKKNESGTKDPQLQHYLYCC